MMGEMFSLVITEIYLIVLTMTVVGYGDSISMETSVPYNDPDNPI